MKPHLRAAGLFLVFTALAAGSACAAEASFERDLTVSGALNLSVVTGAGSIHLSSGPAGHVHIVGRIKSRWGADETTVRQIADHPPIEQADGSVRIGFMHENLHNISIDYEIQAPPGALLAAASGSGDIVDNGVGTGARLKTGSGSVRALALQGGCTVGTGSGSIYAELAGLGDVKAETGSGSIEIRNLHGGLRAETGSGSIRAAGVPSAGWRLDTGSGSIEIWTGSAAFSLDAQTGSGSISSDREIAMRGEVGHHHVTGAVGGGGPTVRLETGSGSIRIH